MISTENIAVNKATKDDGLGLPLFSDLDFKHFSSRITWRNFERLKHVLYIWIVLNVLNILNHLKMFIINLIVIKDVIFNIHFNIVPLNIITMSF